MKLRKLTNFKDFQLAGKRMDEKSERVGSLNKNFLIQVKNFNILKKIDILNSISYFNAFSLRKYGHNYRDTLYIYGYNKIIFEN